jgi:hypothetical protein
VNGQALRWPNSIASSCSRGLGQATDAVGPAGVVVDEVFDIRGHGYTLDVATGLDFGGNIAGDIL